MFINFLKITKQTGLFVLILQVLLTLVSCSSSDIEQEEVTTSPDID